jgi:hypothetical protein
MGMDPIEFLKNAQQCIQLAHGTADIQEQSDYLTLALSWTRLAADTEELLNQGYELSYH